MDLSAAAGHCTRLDIRLLCVWQRLWWGFLASFRVKRNKLLQGDTYSAPGQLQPGKEINAGRGKRCARPARRPDLVRIAYAETGDDLTACACTNPHWTCTCSFFFHLFDFQAFLAPLQPPTTAVANEESPPLGLHQRMYCIIHSRTAFYMGSRSLRGGGSIRVAPNTCNSILRVDNLLQKERKKRKQRLLHNNYLYALCSS